MARVVLFDAVGTLIFPRPSVAEVYHAAGRRFGSRRGPREIAERFRAALRRHHAPLPEGAGFQGSSSEVLGSGAPGRRERPHSEGRAETSSRYAGTDEAGERRRWRRIVGEVFDDVSDGEPLFEQLWHHFAQPDAWRVFDDVTPAWDALRARGLRLGIASNFDGRLEAICRGLPPLNSSDFLFHSANIGYAKPAPQFYERVAERVGLPPANILLVGDDWRQDYLAARQAGFQALWLAREDIQAAHGDRPRIRSLTEIHQQLK